jgi:hypothetical protein
LYLYFIKRDPSFIYYDKVKIDCRSTSAIKIPWNGQQQRERKRERRERERDERENGQQHTLKSGIKQRNNLKFKKIQLTFSEIILYHHNCLLFAHSLINPSSAIIPTCDRWKREEIQIHYRLTREREREREREKEEKERREREGELKRERERCITASTFVRNTII